MRTVSLDYFTITVYLMIAFLFFTMSKSALSKERFVNAGICTNAKYNRLFWKKACIAILIVTFIATFRMVGDDIGGRDTLNYISDFSRAQFLKGDGIGFLSEGLFSLYLASIHSFTDNYRIFFFISYALIAWSYFIYIKKYGKYNYSAIPYMLLALSFVKNFSSVRTGLAVALITAGLVYVDKKILSLALMIAAIFVHRMSIPFVLVFFFYHLFKRYGSKISTKKIIVFVAAFICVSVFVATRLQGMIVKLSVLSSTDLWYLLHNKGNSLLDVWPMWFAHALLLATYVCVMRFETFENKNNIAPIKIIFLFDIIILPMSLRLGIYRANEFFFINRMVLWSYVIELGKNYFRSYSRQLYKFIIALLFIFWFIFRLISEGFDMGIMYYRFSF